MQGGLGKRKDYYKMVNFREDSGEHTSVAETSSLTVFVAPRPCTIIDIGLAATTAVAADGTNTWSIQIANQTGGLNLLSAAFDTDSANSGNGGRAIGEDELTSLTDDGLGNSYLQNATLAKGDVLLLTATEGNSPTALANPVIVIQYRP